MKPVHISATLQDSGKTSISLGLMQVLKANGLNPGYSKPVGQHYVEYQNHKIDEDAVLMHQVFNLPDQPHYLSPIAIERGFTRKFIFNPDVAPLENEVVNCHNELLKNHSMMIVEGTGHAGVGSCFGLSNARVAELLGAKVVIVTSGGIGRPIDEIAVSLALFKQHNVEVLGVILNKVLVEKYDKITETVDRGLQNLGTKLLGSIPFEHSLTDFTMGQVAQEFNYEIMCGNDSLTNPIEHTLVAAMEPQNVLHYIRDNTLIIMPGDRVDNILVSIIVLSQNKPHGGGIILTGGFQPDEKITPLLEKSRIPVLISSEDTFTVSSRMKDIGFKIRSCDTEKIARLHNLVKKNVDTEFILNSLK